MNASAPIPSRRSPSSADERLHAGRRGTIANPDDAGSWYELADALREHWLLVEAAEAFARVIAIDPGHALAWAGQGFVQAVRGKPEDGLRSCRQALRLQSNLAVAHRHQASALALLGRNDEAAREAAEARRIDPDSPENAIALAAGWHRLGLHGAALRMLDRTAAVAPGIAETHVNRSLIHLALGDPVAANTDLESALALKPWLPPAHAVKAILLRAEGRFEVALESVSQACDLHPDSEDYHILRLELLLTLQRHEEALALADAGLRRWPANRVLRLLRARKLLEDGNLDAARRAIPGALPEAAAASLWQALGDLWLTCDRRVTDAIAAFNRSLAIDPEQSALRHRVTILCLAQGLSREALAHVQTLNPDTPETLLLHCDCLERTDRAAEALTLLRDGLEQAPTDARMLQRLGQILRRQGKADEAIVLLDQSLIQNDQDPATHSEMAMTLIDLGRLEKAEAPLRAAIRLAPTQHQLRFSLAVLLSRLRRWQEAEPLLREALHKQPFNLQILGNLAQVLLEQKRFDEVCELVEPELERAPGDIGLRMVLINAHQGARRFSEAISAARLWTEEQPDSAPAWGVLARSLSGLHDPEADAAAAQLMAIEPESVATLETMGIVAMGLGRYREALEWFDKGLALQPEANSLLVNRAFAMQEVASPEGEALAALERVAEAEPESPAARMNLALTLLRLGRFGKGWADYEVRDSVPQGTGALKVPEDPSAPRPDLSESVVMVRCEQGLGDTIHFLRYIPRIAADSREVLLSIQDGLAWMAFGLAPNLRVFGYRDPLPQADHSIALLSLPGWYGTDANSIPARVPYLQPDPERVAHWRERLGTEGFRIGINWQTNPMHGNVRRWIPLAMLARLGDLPGVRLISLQKHHGLYQLEALRSSGRIEELGADFDEGPDAFADTAAVIENLDLVVSIDTSAAHLAGALGRPVWALLPFNSDWRWLVDREDSPWYPTLRLFRQATPDDWNSVATALLERLEQVLSGDCPVIWPVTNSAPMR